MNIIKEVDINTITKEEYCEIYNKYYMYNILKIFKCCKVKFLDPQNIYVRTTKNTSTFDWIFPIKSNYKEHPNYLIEEYKGKADKLANDIMQNGMYAPIFVFPDNENSKTFCVFEGVHRVLSFRFLYSLLGIETNVKMLSIVLKALDTSYKTTIYKYDSGKIILTESETISDILNSVIGIDMQLLNILRENLNYHQPSKFFTDEKVFMKEMKNINWDLLEQTKISPLIIVKEELI